MRSTALLLALLVLATACASGDGEDGTPVAAATKDDGAGEVDEPATSAAADTSERPPADASPGPTSQGSPPEATPTATTTSAPAPTPSAPPTEGLPGDRYVQIDGIRTEGQAYAVDFTPLNFTPLIGSGPDDFHIHFFWDTVAPENAGTNGPAPEDWILYDGPSPFTEYGFAARPPAATGLCALVADAAHGVTLGSGDCVTLP